MKNGALDPNETPEDETEIITPWEDERQLGCR